MENLLFIVVLLLVGAALRLTGKFPENTPAVLADFVIYVSLPALILSRVPGLALEASLILPAVTPWVLLAVSVCLVLVLSRLFGWSRETTAVLLMLSGVGNTSFLGVAMLDALLGEEAVPHALIYDVLGSSLIVATYGTVVVTLAQSDNARVRLGQIVKRVLLFPPFLALVLSVVLRFVDVPSLVTGWLETIGGTLIPLVMIAVGFEARLRVAREDAGPLAAGLAIKMLVGPLLALAAFRLLSVDSLAARASVLEAGMPPMVTAWALTVEAGLRPRLASALVAFGIPVALVTVPLLNLLL